ncbi:hypothetical protein C0J52_21788 [Blattella germanica]|nr:hypothetical protein C0J52_21788 [Blattella germanica]
MQVWTRSGLDCEESAPTKIQLLDAKQSREERPGHAAHLPPPFSLLEKNFRYVIDGYVAVVEAKPVVQISGNRRCCSCKIKALRAKTNTYIKTPVRGEEPVFVVTGRKEDVAKAKREILSAAEHFSQIRASRKNNLGGGGLGGVGGNSTAPPGPPANVPGHVTIQVRVPYRVVGLVVGPKGATIKRIQHQTHTYIVTPSRDKEPVFEVTGLPESVETARREIEAHIAMRTGNGTLAGSLSSAGLAGTLLGSTGLIDDSPDLLASLYKSGLGSLFSYLDNGMAPTTPASTAGLTDATVPLSFPTMTSSTGSTGAFSSSGSCSSSSSSSGSAGQGSRLGDLVSIWNGSLDRDEGLGESPPFETATAPSSIWSFPSGGSTVPATRPSPAASVSPTDSLTSLGSLGGLVGGSSGGAGSGGRRDCLVCGEKEVDAALVPCGHNLFCLDCANRLCDADSTPICPVCQLPVAQAIRIFS